MKQLIKILNFLALLIYCGFIYWLSDQANLAPPDLGFTLQDKLYHAGAYFIMAVFAWRSFAHYTKSSVILAVSTAIFCSVYGVSDELHQSFTVNRVADAMDWLADTTGAVSATFFLYKLRGYVGVTSSTITQGN